MQPAPRPVVASTQAVPMTQFPQLYAQPSFGGAVSSGRGSSGLGSYRVDAERSHANSMGSSSHGGFMAARWEQARLNASQQVLRSAAVEQKPRAQMTAPAMLSAAPTLEGAAVSPPRSYRPPPPTGRELVGDERLEARDRWNTYEHHIQEIFMKYDKDNSGALDMEEFRELLRDFNNGRTPTEQECNFIMRIADKDNDGQINLGEMHYAIRAWHSYCNLDDNVLRLFAEFDTDTRGRLDVGELRELLTAANGGVGVSWSEVQHVMVQAQVLGDGVINRSELLGAIAAWYAQVDRKDSDVPLLFREAVARTVKEHDSMEFFNVGTKSFELAKAVVSGDVQAAYVAVGANRSPWAEIAAADSLSARVNAASLSSSFGHGDLGQLLAPDGNPSDRAMGTWPVSDDPARRARDGESLLVRRLQKAMPYIVRSCNALCFVALPFLFNLAMFGVGWSTRINECPRNLDGLLVWFGLLGLILSASMHVDINDYDMLLGRMRLACMVIMTTLNLVGLLWTHDPDALSDTGYTLCGTFLVTWSLFVWAAIPIGSCGYACYHIAAHYRRLQKQDEFIQSDVIVT